MSLNMSMPMMDQDKANHFIWGLAIFSFGFILNIWAGIILCAVIAAVKELYHDKYLGKGTPDYKDFLATLAGGLSGAAVAVLAFLK